MNPPLAVPLCSTQKLLTTWNM